MKAKSSFFSVPELIAQKRDGLALSNEQIKTIIEAYTDGRVPDYQMSALAMAIYFQGMNDEETVALTMAMRDSGRIVDLSSVKARCVDKHSTGGVGDKVSICLAPLVASCGVAVPMVSGRGLGHTGGTLDKLESIPGFNISLPISRVLKQLQTLNCALIGQTKDIAPADKKLYALRDVTGTVESIPLITASILSKKLAAGIDALVLDVKAGQGAFMKNEKDAKALARSLVRVGKLAKKQVTAFLTNMESPLGLSIGNALETKEALQLLHGQGPDDLRECTLVLGAEMLRLGKVVRTEAQGRKRLLEAINDRSALEHMKKIIKAQGGDPRVADEPDRLPSATRKIMLKAPKTGYLRSIDALEIGRCATALGAGRLTVNDSIDPAVGMLLQAKPGDQLRKGAPLVELHIKRDGLDSAIQDRILASFEFSATRPKLKPLILEVLR
ncbi:MAG: thymidine phosphorylase [Myxococcales bacterium]|nr:MAG: thymidine phosphorylase [Myxococcales bacterium]